jgi:hypothetical protein
MLAAASVVDGGFGRAEAAGAPGWVHVVLASPAGPLVALASAGARAAEPDG